jgi:hypothetical protein
MGNRSLSRATATYLTIAGGLLLPVMLSRNVVVLCVVLLCSVMGLVWLIDRKRGGSASATFLGAAIGGQLLNFISPWLTVIFAAVALMPVFAKMKRIRA